MKQKKKWNYVKERKIRKEITSSVKKLFNVVILACIMAVLITKDISVKIIITALVSYFVVELVNAISAHPYISARGTKHSVLAQITYLLNIILLLAPLSIIYKIILGALILFLNIICGITHFNSLNQYCIPRYLKKLPVKVENVDKELFFRIGISSVVDEFIKEYWKNVKLTVEDQVEIKRAINNINNFDKIMFIPNEKKIIEVKILLPDE